MIGNIRIQNIEVEAYDVQSTDRTSSYEDFDSVGGLIAIPKNDQYQEVSFKVDRTKLNEDRDNYLSDLNGQRVAVVSDMFKGFMGRLTARKHGVKGSSEVAEYDITIKEYEN